MAITVNTAIIGGGPAGMACALTLQQGGVDTLVIEKQRFPREKTCGGLVTEKTVQQLERLLGPAPDTLFCEVCNRIELCDRDRRLTGSTVARPFRTVKRKQLDAYLAAQYRARGGRLRESCSCRAVDPKAHTLTLSSGEAVRFRRLVVADGALSPTRRLLGYERPPLAFCVETHIPKTALPEAEAVRIVFGFARRGYAWVFPAGGELCVGFGSAKGDPATYPAQLRALLRLLGADAEGAVVRGAYVPCGRAVSQRRAQKDVLLVGDAGGFVDPIYGEGLYLALTSGIEAAEAIAGGADNVLRDYQTRMKPYRTLIRQGVRFQRLFFSPGVQRRFLRRVAGKDRFVAWFCDRQLARYGYPYAGLTKLLSDYHKQQSEG